MIILAHLSAASLASPIGYKGYFVHLAWFSLQANEEVSIIYCIYNNKLCSLHAKITKEFLLNIAFTHACAPVTYPQV